MRLPVQSIMPASSTWLNKKRPGRAHAGHGQGWLKPGVKHPNIAMIQPVIDAGFATMVWNAPAYFNLRPDRPDWVSLGIREIRDPACG